MSLLESVQYTVHNQLGHVGFLHGRSGDQQLKRHLRASRISANLGTTSLASGGLVDVAERSTVKCSMEAARYELWIRVRNNIIQATF